MKIWQCMIFAPHGDTRQFFFMNKPTKEQVLGSINTFVMHERLCETLTKIVEKDGHNLCEIELIENNKEST